MKARLIAVQQMLWTIVVAALVLVALAFPRGRNRDYMAAVEEISAFGAVFQQKQLEQSLLSYAQSQGVVALGDVAKQVTGPGVPVVTSKPGAPPILPRANVQMSTLSDVLARSSGPSTVNMGAPSAPELAASIAWRLARRPGAEPLTLARIELLDAPVSEDAIKRERSIPALRAAASAAEPVFANATTTLAAVENVYDQRRKRNATWKVMLKADEARKAARTALAASQQDLDTKRAAYERDAKAAESYAPRPGAGTELRALARVTLLTASGKESPLTVPVALLALSAQVPRLQGQTFPATHAAGLWEAVQLESATGALAIVRTHFSWHYQYVEVAGLKLGGLTLLHLLPPVLPLLLFLLLLATRRVTVSYNPFGPTETGTLPRVGFGMRILDLFVLTLLPFAGCILATISLTAIGQIPLLPVISAFVALGLGAYDYIEMGSLQALTEAVSRAHSTAPPPKQ